MTNTLGIMLKILNNYPRTSLAVRIIGAINSNFSQENFAISTWRGLIYSLGHGRKHMLAILLTVWRPGLTHFGGFHEYSEGHLECVGEGRRRGWVSVLCGDIVTDKHSWGAQKVGGDHDIMSTVFSTVRTTLTTVAG